MESNLPYHFRRQSDNFFDWLLNTVKSEKYHEAESKIVTTDASGLRLSL